MQHIEQPDGARPLFEINPALDRRALAREFARTRRIQIRDVLTEATANEVRAVLAGSTPWAIAWQAGEDGPHVIRREDFAELSPARNAEISGKLASAAGGNDYAFVYSSYPMLEAYLDKWNEGGPHDLILEYINDAAFMGLVREVTGLPGLVKADAQATLYAPGHFLALHNDSHVAEGWRLAYVLNMTLGEWQPDWGGYLMFYDDDGDAVGGFKPRFNALNIFAVPQKHNVTYVPPFSPVGRFAITGWFRDR
jgi:Rps23 Pro-64 3,4-dihydroxylase Tpa1-like proline 4-hydroxylase